MERRKQEKKRGKKGVSNERMKEGNVKGGKAVRKVKKKE